MVMLEAGLLIFLERRTRSSSLVLVSRRLSADLVKTIVSHKFSSAVLMASSQAINRYTLVTVVELDE